MQINRMAVGVLSGMLTKVLLDFYSKYKELDDFGHMTYKEAAEMLRRGEGTVAQHERLTHLLIANMHAASDMRSLRAFDPNDPDDLKKLQELIGRNKDNPSTGQYL